MRGRRCEMNFRRIPFNVMMPWPFEGETTLKTHYPDEASVPEAVKGFYKQVGERWELQVSIDGVDGVKSFTDFSNLNNALRKERTDHKAVKTTLGNILKGRTPDDVLADLDEIPALREQVDAGDNVKKIDQLVETKI